MAHNQTFLESIGNFISGRQISDQILNKSADTLKKMEQQKQVVVFGAQGLGQRTKLFLEEKGISTSFFVDSDTRKQGKALDGVEVRSPNDLAGTHLAVVIATTRYIPEISAQLAGLGVKYFIDFPTLTLWDDKVFPVEIPYIGIHEDIASNMKKYEWLNSKLADEKSRNVLGGLLKYRTTFDTHYIAEVYDSPSVHYFDKEILDLSTNEVFVDGGGFDGFTTKTFYNFVRGKYKSVLYFEPSSKMFETSKLALKDLPNVKMFNEGLYSNSGFVSFTSTANVDGKISADGDIKIPVRQIDSLIGEEPTFIKLDIEGAEEEALNGAKNVITQLKPKLAIAAYHKGADLWSLPEQILKMRPDYKIYLRHYSTTGLESVIFAL